MARYYAMTWQASTRRWFKKHKGKMYTVSCRRLGCPDTKEGSAAAANAWWDAKLKEIEASLPGEDDRVSRAVQVSRLVRDFNRLDDDARREAVEALLGPGSYDGLKAQRDAVMASLEPASPERTISIQVDGWKNLLRSACQSRQLSEGRYDAYLRNIKPFVEWIGPETAIDAINEARLEAYYNHLSTQVSSGRYSASYAHSLLMTAKQFIRRLVRLSLIPLPSNIDERRFRFNHSAAGQIETFTIEEVRALLAVCEGYSERTKLYILLCLNCGQYQNDIAELRQHEVDWKKGTLTRARSKTRERGGPVVTYKLWPETFALLKKYRSAGELVLTTEDGNPLVKEWLEEGKYRKYDAIRSAWHRLAQKMGREKNRLGLKHLRKTSATILGEHPHYKYYTTHFLADSPRHMTEKHYVKPSDAEFFEALDWLRGQILG